MTRMESSLDVISRAVSVLSLNSVPGKAQARDVVRSFHLPAGLVGLR
jgi:hypothetical protein